MGKYFVNCGDFLYHIDTASPGVDPPLFRPSSGNWKGSTKVGKFRRRVISCGRIPS